MSSDDVPVLAQRQPDFVVIGAMKSATTTLHEYLAAHPDVFMTPRKETMFFSRDHIYAQGMDWYRSLFAEALPHQRCGEASTCYSRRLRYPEAAGRIARHLPDAKLIYIMRHPVDRLYSHYGHVAQERWANKLSGPVLSLEEFLNGDPEGEEALDASDYLLQIEAYLPFFPRERMYLVTLDRFKSDGRAVLSEVQAFLGLEQHDLIQARGHLRSNERGSVVTKEKVTRLLRGVRRAPGISLIADLAGQRLRSRTLVAARKLMLKSALARRFSADFESRLDPMTPEIRARLVEHFHEPVRNLERFLGQELPAWHR